MWVVTPLWPSAEAVIGVYDHPPPDEPALDSIAIDRDSPVLDDFFNREALKTAIALTKLKDRVRGWIP